MLVIMKREEFDSLADEALFHACFKPLILEYKKEWLKKIARWKKYIFIKN